MRILVTGATGFIGRALATRLASERQNDVAILVRESYRVRPLPEPLNNLADRLIVVYADLRDYHNTRRALHAVRPAAIFHLAAGGARDPFLPVDAAIEQNLYGTLNLLRAAFDDGFSHRPEQMIVVRTPGEIGLMNPYAASKAAAWGFCEMYARTEQWPILGVMPFQTYGPGQHKDHLVSGAMMAALAGEDFPLTAGTQERDWIYISDVIDGLLAAQGAGLPAGSTVDLGTGTLTSVADVVRQVYEITGGRGKPLIGALPSRAGEVPVQIADIEQTKELTGWQSAVSLEQGLSRYYEHLLRHAS